MTDLLERALAEVAKLPPPEQDEVAEWLLTKLHSEKGWSAAFESSERLIGSLADEALSEHQRGLSEPLDPDKL
ncbi:MAG: hypothetical protein ABIQ65_15460 [Thermoanaerobaculia bacterium]